MRCRICGAKLKKEGDICRNCYKKFQEEEDLKKDNKERLVIKRKYLINYIFLKYTWLVVIFTLAAIGSFAYSGVLSGLLTIFMLFAFFGFILFWDKKMANATKVVFYDKHMTYTCKWWIFNTEKIVKYSDLHDATYFQTMSQKKFGLGDLCVYAKGAIPGNSIFNGFQIKNVENVAEAIPAIAQVVGPLED